VQLAIRRSGYVARRLTVDGSKPRVVVGLVPERHRGATRETAESEEAEADKAAAESVDKGDLSSGPEELSEDLPAPKAGAKASKALAEPSPDSDEPKSAPKEPTQAREEAYDPL
jgi:hypothetical protein